MLTVIKSCLFTLLNAVYSQPMKIFWGVFAVHFIFQNDCHQFDQVNLIMLHFIPQKYLRSFFSAMLKSPSSPLNIDKVGLTLSKYTICEFSPFFRKGVFDYSSHGTS